MKKVFKVENVSCSSCANLIKNSLEDEFGVIEVNLETTPKEVSVEINNEEQKLSFKKEIYELGFPIIEN